MSGTPGRTLKAYQDLRSDQTTARRRFIGELCHELRSALTVIGGNADMIALRQPEMEDQVAPIIAAADRIEDILRTLLEAAEVDQEEFASRAGA